MPEEHPLGLALQVLCRRRLNSLFCHKKRSQRQAMTSNRKNIRRIELAVFCLFGAFGTLYCNAHHFCMCGHLAHTEDTIIRPILEDGIWMLGFIGATVVGLCSGFLWGRITGYISSLALLFMFARPHGRPVQVLAVVLFSLVAYHTFVFLRSLFSNNTAEQVGGGNALEPPSHPATAPSKSRATP